MPYYRDFNPYAGCIAGHDCPWYRSKTGETHCESSPDIAGIHGLRETPELCCKQHFGYIDVTTCVADSLADVAAAKAKVEQDLARPHYYYPDLFGRKNCVRDSDYEDWMQGAVSCSSIRFVIDSVITWWRPRGCIFSLPYIS